MAHLSSHSSTTLARTQPVTPTYTPSHSIHLIKKVTLYLVRLVSSLAFFAVAPPSLDPPPQPTSSQCSPFPFDTSSALASAGVAMLLPATPVTSMAATVAATAAEETRIATTLVSRDLLSIEVIPSYNPAITDFAGTRGLTETGTALGGNGSSGGGDATSETSGNAIGGNTEVESDGGNITNNNSNEDGTGGNSLSGNVTGGNSR